MITFNRRRDRQQGRPPQFLRGPVFFSKSDCARRDVPRLLEAVPEIRERRLVEELGAESEISREGIVISTVFTGQLLTACHESVSIKSMG